MSGCYRRRRRGCQLRPIYTAGKATRVALLFQRPLPGCLSFYGLFLMFILTRSHRDRQVWKAETGGRTSLCHWLHSGALLALPLWAWVTWGTSHLPSQSGSKFPELFGEPSPIYSISSQSYPEIQGQNVIACGKSLYPLHSTTQMCLFVFCHVVAYFKPGKKYTHYHHQRVIFEKLKT